MLCSNIFSAGTLGRQFFRFEGKNQVNIEEAKEFKELTSYECYKIRLKYPNPYAKIKKSYRLDYFKSYFIAFIACCSLFVRFVSV